MDERARDGFDAMAEAPWIETASAGELDGLFIHLTGREDMIPPNRRSRYPSRLMLLGSPNEIAIEELRVAARLARHLTAAGDLTYSRKGGPFSHLEKRDDRWYAMRMTWHRARMCESIEEAAGILMGSVYADLSELQPALDAFDAEHGHPPSASPAP